MAAEADLAYWKVLELSFDCVAVPYLIQEHRYGAFDGDGPTVIPETTVEETARAVRRLVAAGAVRVADDEHTLTEAEIEALLCDPGSWDSVSGAFRVEVVNEPKATDLLAQRPPGANPHQPSE